mmetsp:Transcript_16630/g.63000  ORF Transcript_16630/g.63000 Transcript_16630/m.63000 type:complete len:205 (+) Transcript_16630:1334-1948(+)
MTLPSAHMRAPYTRISCWPVTMSALFITTRILSSLPRSASMVLLNSSEMSSLCASNRSRIMSARAANHSTTRGKSYMRPARCFSPESTPGVSTRVTRSRTGALHWAASSRLIKFVPKRCRLVNGMSRSTARALPGIVRSSSPLMMIVNRSVVGSGPMRMPGKSRPRRCLIKVVFPTEYWPSSSTMGFESMSASVRMGLWNSPYR